MNPLNRKMFRQPGMSRQPAGILASSPELANVVRQRMGQPVQMANGGMNANDTISNQLMAIQQLRGMGDKATLTNIARDQRLPRSVQMAAANALSGIKPKESGPVQQVPLAPTDKLPSLVAPPVMSVRGGGDQIPVNINPSAEQVPVSTVSVDPSAGGITSLTNVDPMTKIGSSMSTDMLNRIRQARNLDPIPETTSDSLVGAARAALPEGTPTLDVLAANQAETVRLMKNDATDTELAAAQAEGMSRRGDFPDRPSGDLPKAATDTATDTATPETSEPAAEEAATALATDPSTLLPQISEVLEGKGSNKKKADAIDETLNIKGTRKERTEQRYQMLKELLGEDKAKDIRTDANYNLMMTGLMIAAGQSGDAMTNIATGLAKGLAGYGKASGEAAQAATKEEKALKLMAAKEVGDEMTAETAAKIRAGELADDRAFKIGMKREELSAAMDRAKVPSAQQRLLESYLTSDQIVSVLNTPKSRTGQALTSERFAQEVLKTRDGRQDTMDAMIASIPRFTTETPPSLGEMFAYLQSTSEATGLQTTDSLVGQETGPYGATTERNGKTYTWNKDTGKYDPQN